MRSDARVGLGSEFGVRRSKMYRPQLPLSAVCDSRYGNLRAGKQPFIRDGARFALRLARVGLSRLGEGRKTVT